MLDKTWSVPAGRMKAHREHRVPPSPRALTILAEMQAARNSEANDAYVFPDPRPGKPLSNMAFMMPLRRRPPHESTSLRVGISSWTLLLHNYRRANLSMIVKVDDVIVGQTNAAGRYVATKPPRLVRPMDAV